MATYQQLKTRAEQVRDEQTIGGNTALRVGQLLCDMVDKDEENADSIDNLSVYYTGTQNNPIIETLNNPQGLHWLQSPIVALVSMGEDLDGDAGAVVQEGDLYYYNHSGFQIFVKGSGGSIGVGYKARKGVLFINKYTGKFYEWTGSFMSEITLAGTGGGGGGNITVEQIKANIDILAASLNRLYAKLDNLAFWSAQDKTEAAPTALDWGAPKHTVTLSLTLTHAVVKYNGVVKNNGDTIPNVEEGSTIQLTVEAESGYELDSISSQAGTVNGSIVSLVMGRSNATLDITASASSAYSISYDLTNCAAPTGVTNPTTIKSGETKTIYLEAGNNFIMPASLPAGAVTGATAAYTRDSQDDTLASIVLSNATGNVTVDLDGVEVLPELHLVLQAFIVSGNNQYFIQGGSYNSNAKRRAMVVVKRADTTRPCTWGSTDGISEDPALEAEYSAIPIPSGATQVTMKCNSTYYYALGLLNSSGVAQNADFTWTVGSTQKSLTLADYPTATHILLNFKIGSAGTTNFSNETYESMGIDFNIE